MPRNVEIKARIGSIAAVSARAAAIADSGPTEIAQDDTFFPCPAGRLKLRQFADGSGELIFYQRADAQGPKESFYLLARTADADALRTVLSHAYGTAGRVVKQRTLFLAGPTRIHLDRVHGLGEFLELEVVLADEESVEQGVQTAHRVMASLGVDAAQLVEGAYVDLLREAAPAAQSRSSG
ncbi:MAG: class IV adenylate cyclase [Gemmatimonadetes bacterium]|nr:class IV adenylate cyclase [Gemmatimonadota bacterium]